MDVFQKAEPEAPGFLCDPGPNLWRFALHQRIDHQGKETEAVANAAWDDDGIHNGGPLRR